MTLVEFVHWCFQDFFRWLGLVLLLATCGFWLTPLLGVTFAGIASIFHGKVKKSEPDEDD